MKKNTFLLIILPLLCSCGGIDDNSENGGKDTSEDYFMVGDSMNDFLPEVGTSKLLFKHSTTETVGDDGEDYFYNYCPSLKIENGVEHVYYCTNKDWANVTDYIGYRSGKIIDNELRFSEEKLVISPTKDTWDERHVCDPTVVKGKFKYNGEEYPYLMAYLGCVPSDCTLNETGIAVAKSYEGPWIKCNGKTTTGAEINPVVPYKDFGCVSTSWGTGQASLLSVDQEGKVLLFTTVGCPSGSFTDVREYDFSNINELKLLRESKVFIDGVEGTTKRVNNADYCFDPKTKRFFMAKGRSPFGKDGEIPNFIADTVDLYYCDASGYENPFDIFFDNKRTEKWTLVGSIDKTLSGYPRNHNCGLVTNEYGQMYTDEKIGVAFTSSQYGSSAAMTYLKTYRIYITTFNV